MPTRLQVSAKESKKDEKLVIRKANLSSDIDRIKKEGISYSEIENLVEKKFLSSEDKKSGEYIILQHSFTLSYEDMIFIANRSPIGFDEDKRLTKGMSIFLSISGDGSKAIEDKIKKEFMFYSEKKEVITEIAYRRKDIGFAYRDYSEEELDQNNSLYFFFIYEVDITTNLYDIVTMKNKNNILDMDYLFPIDKNFLSKVHESFLNKKAHLDICYIESFGNSGKSFSYHKTKYFPQNIFDHSGHGNLYKINYDDSEKKNFAKKIKTYIKNNTDGIIADLMTSISDDEFAAIAEIAKCFFKVPMGIVKLKTFLTI